jgi:predicted metalloprotease
MRRLFLPLVVCAFVVACTAGPPPAVPSTSSMPDWTPNILRPDSSDSLEPGEGADDGVAENGGKARKTIYNAPKAKVKCTMPAVKEGNWASMTRYLDEVSSCLDRIWLRELREINVLFVPPRREYVRKRIKHPACGLMPAKGADGTYCSAVKTYFILLDPADVRRPWKAWAAQLAAHEYGHHVQYLTRILQYQAAMTDAAADKKTKDLVSRRLELQAECFSGVALQAMRRSLPPWDEFRYLYSGTLPKQWILDHGRPQTQYRWMKKGYQSGKPGSCDTWTPAPAKVT